jgi:hypothetical protein
VDVSNFPLAIAYDATGIRIDVMTNIGSFDFLGCKYSSKDSTCSVKYSCAIFVGYVLYSLHE